MSDCGVCISSYEGDYGCTGYRCVIVKAGQDWRCCECHTVIPKGAKYERATWFNDGSFGQAKTCLVCAEIANAFSCGGRWHGNDFWESMEYVWEKLTTGCFDRLQTPEAKAELRRRWMAWKGLTV
jgi:hypothetical protein